MSLYFTNTFGASVISAVFLRYFGWGVGMVVVVTVLRTVLAIRRYDQQYRGLGRARQILLVPLLGYLCWTGSILLALIIVRLGAFESPSSDLLLLVAVAISLIGSLIKIRTGELP